RFEVAAKRLGTLCPRRPARRIGFGPISLGPCGRNVLRVPAELEDIPLREAHVLQQLPRRMRCSGRLCTGFLTRQFSERGLKAGVCAFAFEEVQQMPAQTEISR